MDNLVTADLITGKLKEWVETRQVISPSLWVDAALKLSLFISDETAKLYDLQQEVAKVNFNCIENGGAISKCKVYVQTLDKYKEMKKQEAKVEQILENIRIAKTQARMSSDEIKAY